MQVLAIPAQGFQLLVPVSMVAQVAGRLPLTPTSLDIPGAAGIIQWRQFSLPLFRTSELLGRGAADDDDFRHVVVLWPMKSAGNRSFVALTSPGPPRVIDVDDHPATDGDAGIPWVLAYVSLPEGLGVIPDIDALARRAWNRSASGTGND